MDVTHTIDAGELSADEISGALHDGQRLQVSVELLDQHHRITLRYDGEIYYCETPTRLHKHSDEAAMRACIEERGYAATSKESS